MGLSQMTPAALARPLLTALAAFVGAQTADWLHMPLPWMLGAMFGVACISLTGQAYPQPKWARRSAQLFIGSALGLFFTPVIFQQLWGMLHWIVMGALSVILLSLLVAPLLQKMAGLDGPTTLYAVSLGGAAEMSMQAQEMGADAPMVALSHTLRIVLVTLCTSLMAGASGVALPTSGPGPEHLSIANASALLLSSFFVGRLFVRLHIASPWKLGALLAGCLCALAGMQGRWPQQGIVVAQMVVGWGLGQGMTRSFFTRAPLAMLAMSATTLLLLLACMGVGAIAAALALPMPCAQCASPVATPFMPKARC